MTSKLCGVIRADQARVFSTMWRFGGIQNFPRKQNVVTVADTDMLRASLRHIKSTESKWQDFEKNPYWPVPTDKLKSNTTQQRFLVAWRQPWFVWQPKSLAGLSFMNHSFTLATVLFGTRADGK